MYWDCEVFWRSARSGPRSDDHTGTVIGVHFERDEAGVWVKSLQIECLRSRIPQPTPCMPYLCIESSYCDTSIVTTSFLGIDATGLSVEFSTVPESDFPP